MKAALVIMAAGMGSRYGGDKQVEGIGPNGEMLMEYSIYDAVQAGFTKVVLVIKPDIETMIRGMVGELLSRLRTREGEPVETAFVYQDFSGLPDFYTLPAERVRPFGTCHAVFCAHKAVREPFVVINADDYYGQSAFRTAYETLCKLPPEGHGAMVAYLLKNTVSEHGTVSRGICDVENGRLAGVTEKLKLKLYPNGEIRDVADGEENAPLFSGDAPVSMNFWCFTPSVFGEMERYFHDFLRSLQPGELKKECMLPVLVDQLLRTGKMTVEVGYSADRWFGMTYREDRPLVREALQTLHDTGAYPARLG